MKDYKIIKTSFRREFTKAELNCSATGTALIIDDADFGLMAIIPTKNRLYPSMWLSEQACKKAHSGMVVELSEAHVLTVITKVEYLSTDKRGGESKGEIFLDF